MDTEFPQVLDNRLLELLLLLARIRVVKPHNELALVPPSVVVVQQHGLSVPDVQVPRGLGREAGGNLEGESALEHVTSRNERIESSAGRELRRAVDAAEQVPTLEGGRAHLNQLEPPSGLRAKVLEVDGTRVYLGAPAKGVEDGDVGQGECAPGQEHGAAGGQGASDALHELRTARREACRLGSALTLGGILHPLANLSLGDGILSTEEGQGQVQPLVRLEEVSSAGDVASDDGVGDLAYARGSEGRGGSPVLVHLELEIRVEAGQRGAHDRDKGNRVAIVGGEAQLQRLDLSKLRNLALLGGCLGLDRGRFKSSGHSCRGRRRLIRRWSRWRRSTTSSSSLGRGLFGCLLSLLRCLLGSILRIRLKLRRRGNTLLLLLLVLLSV
mmetsp:Transcript_24724/g.49192  ORF Transcript_24724/g.49192 Transcript_24724/m.49192 type:complete len:385 (+) Transcript_24724:1472-2626(+)